MPIPRHEQLKGGSDKPGPRLGGKGTPTAILDRVVDIGTMMFGQNLTPLQIYRWNKAENPKDPKHLEKWDYSYRQIWRMCQSARAQGSSLLCKTLDEAVRYSMMGYADLHRKACAAGDYKVAFMCVREMSALRGVYLPKNVAAIKKMVTENSENEIKSPMEWAPVVEAETQEADFDGIGVS